MTVNKLSRKQLVLSIVAFLCGAIGLAVTVLLMIVINEGKGTSDYFVNNQQEVIIESVALCFLVATLYVYLFFENKSYLARISKVIEIFLLLYISLMLAYAFGKFVDNSARPLIFIALMGTMLFKRRDAIFFNTMFSLMLLTLDRFTGITGIEHTYEIYSTLFCAFCVGILSVYIMRNVKTRIGSVFVALVLLPPIELVNFIMHLTSTEWHISMAPNMLLWCAIGDILSIMLFMIFLPIFEVMFAELTVFRLRELTSDDAKLIKRLKTNAPGTYNHSVIVAQIVEACAKEIGENSELARAAAYYHDMGKLKQPEMFAENQTEYNFHTELTPELSADIIRSHARDGAKLIKKNRLPDFFADVAVQHHGTMPIKYFYVKALKMSDGELNVENYSYLGPTPTTKIAAMIMIADASEAATRSLESRTPENVEALVRNLIEERLDMGQFDDCNITMRELSVIKSTIVNQLTGVYHSRVSYPKLTISKKK